MKERDWWILGFIAFGLYWLSAHATVPSAPLPGLNTGNLSLPPGLPSGQAAINAALGYDAFGNPITVDASGNLVSTPIGTGYTDLVVGVTPLSAPLDASLSDPTGDGFSQLLPSTPLPGLNA